MSYRILFQPMGIIASIEDDETILQAAQKAGVYIEATCNGQKACGKCRVKIVEGVFDSHKINSSLHNVSAMTATDQKFFTKKELKKHYRLACITKVFSDIVVEIPVESRRNEQVILKETKCVEIEMKPAVKAYYIQLDRATLEDHRDDCKRLTKALKDKYKDLSQSLEIDFQVLKALSHTLRSADWKVTAIIWNNQKIIKVEAGINKNIYGLAIDVGTTTIAAYLCDLESGEIKGSDSMMNPQICYGDDVLTRVSHCNECENGVEELQKLLLDGLNQLIESIAEKEEIDRTQIIESVIVFNTVMQHIALGISPRSIGVSPFISVFSDSLDIKASDLGLHILPTGNVHCLPSEAGFIGSDNVAVLIAEEAYKQDKMKLIIDIGTNSEIALGNNEKLYATSCATGPALEGAQIECGMRAAEGAIEAVEINPVTLEAKLKIIGGEGLVPIGICGSGILDAIAQMAVTGIIEPNGKFSNKVVSDRVRYGDKGKKEYVLYLKQSDIERDIIVSQKDVRAVQLAKAALYAGAKALLNKAGIDSVDEIILAGAFGSYIDKSNALALGLFPDCHLDHVKVVGNAAGLGAKMALLNVDKRAEAKMVAEAIVFVETARNDDYQTMFAKAMAIPHDNHSFSVNHPMIWKCSGNDNRVANQALLTDGMKILEDDVMMEKVILDNQKIEARDYLVFPLMEKIEAVAYGGCPKLVGKHFVIGTYCFDSIEAFDYKQSILENKIIQNTLTCIERQSNQRIILEVEGPFSILATLIDPTKLFVYKRKNKEKLMEVLLGIGDALAEYTIEAIKRGVDIISFADPEGVAEIVGGDVYRELSGAVSCEYFKKVKPYLKKTLIHLCGKTSYSLQSAGYVTSKVYRYESEKPYIEILFDYAQNKKFEFVGHNCIHAKQLKVPIIRKIEMVNN